MEVKINKFNGSDPVINQACANWLLAGHKLNTTAGDITVICPGFADFLDGLWDAKCHFINYGEDCKPSRGAVLKRIYTVIVTDAKWDRAYIVDVWFDYIDRRMRYAQSPAEHVGFDFSKVDGWGKDIWSSEDERALCPNSNKGGV